MTDEEAIARLTERLAELAAQDAASAEARAPVTLQQDSVGRLSRMDALQGQAMALAGQRRRDAERARIRAALQRVDAGDFGWCIACGEPIAEKRLANDPGVAHCIGCADKR